MIQADGLKIAFGKKVLLENVSFRVNKGECIGIIGKNGMGKTSLLKTLAGMVNPSAGKVYLKGKNLVYWKRKELARELAFMGQEPLFTEMLSVEDFIKISHRSVVGRQKMSFDEICKDLEIEHLKKRFVHTLSQGEFKKTYLASAVYQGSTILLLDEPFSSIDPGFQVNMIKFLKKINKIHSTTILMVVHDLKCAFEFSCKILALSEDSSFFYKNVEKYDKDLLSNIYGVDMEIFKRADNGKMIAYTV